MTGIRLEWRLALFGMATALVAVGVVSLLGRRSVNHEFRRFMADQETHQARNLAAALGRLTDPRQAQALLDEAAPTMRRDLLLVDDHDACLAGAPKSLCEFRLSRGPGEEIRLERNQSGIDDLRVFLGAPRFLLDSHATLYVLPPRLQLEARPDTFLESTQRALWWAAAGAAAVSILLSFLWARWMLHPVRRLTTVVQGMERGDLRSRAPVESRDEIGGLARAFNAMAESLSRQEQLRRNLANDVAHELRTPLTKIRCQLEAIQDGVTPPGAPVIDSLHDDVMLLARLVDDLRDLSLAEVGQLRLVKEVADVKAELERAIRANQAAAAEKFVELRLEATDDLQPIVIDRERFAQIFNNLLVNAVRVTPPGGHVAVKAWTDESMTVITVSDTGPGIAPEHLPHIFDRFYRVDPSRSRDTGGAGLGLAIVKQLVEAHGGSVSAASQQEQGCCVTVRLPRLIAD